MCSTLIRLVDLYVLHKRGLNLNGSVTHLPRCWCKEISFNAIKKSFTVRI